MKALKSIPYEEYEANINKIGALLKEIEYLSNKNRDYVDELDFIKNSGDGIMIIEKVGAVTTHEYKSDVSNMATKLVDENKMLIDMVNRISSEIKSMEAEKVELMTKLALSVGENTMLNMELGEMRNRNILKRLINKK